MADNPTSQTAVKRMPDDPNNPRHRSVPPASAYPADYGLANVTSDLITQYGRDGAINRLIEMAERIASGERPGDWVMRRQRVDPTDRIIAEQKRGAHDAG